MEEKNKELKRELHVSECKEQYYKREYDIQKEEIIDLKEEIKRMKRKYEGDDERKKRKKIL